MKTLNEKKQMWITILILCVFVMGSLYIYYYGGRSCESKVFIAKKGLIEKQDSLDLAKISNLLKTQNTKILELKKDSTNANLKTLLEENFKVNYDEYKALQNKKNEDILKYMKVVFGNNTPLLVCVIIIVCGILGGYASNFYTYLKDILETTEKLVDKAETITEATNDSNQIGEELKKVNAQLEDLKKDINNENKTIIASILFGIIASFFSILILKAGDSNILKFETYMDYFVFTCYCLLSALFTKKIIEAIINTVIKKYQNNG